MDVDVDANECTRGRWVGLLASGLLNDASRLSSSVGLRICWCDDRGLPGGSSGDELNMADDAELEGLAIPNMESISTDLSSSSSMAGPGEEGGRFELALENSLFRASEPVKLPRRPSPTGGVCGNGEGEEETKRLE